MKHTLIGHWSLVVGADAEDTRPTTYSDEEEFRTGARRSTKKIMELRASRP